MTFTPGVNNLARKDHQSRKACVCECVGFLARSQLKWSLIVFRYYLIVKKSILACHSSEDLFRAGLLFWYSVMSIFALHSG